jgi:hypothetical protein
MMTETGVRKVRLAPASAGAAEQEQATKDVAKAVRVLAAKIKQVAAVAADAVAADVVATAAPLASLTASEEGAASSVLEAGADGAFDMDDADDDDGDGDAPPDADDGNGAPKRAGCKRAFEPSEGDLVHKVSGGGG